MKKCSGRGTGEVGRGDGGGGGRGTGAHLNDQRKASLHNQWILRVVKSESPEIASSSRHTK